MAGHEAELAHPTGPDPGAGAPEHFVRVEERACADPRWHFGLLLPRDSVRAGGAAKGPSDERRTVSLGLYQRLAPAGDVEVMGRLLHSEIDPADWLDKALADLGRAVVSRRPVPLLGGVVGDAVASWEHEGESFAGRFVATKWGPRLFVACCRTRRADYAALADDFFASAASLRPLAACAGAFAEDVNFVEQDRPFAWRVAVPESWEIVRHPAIDEGAWFEATHIAPGPPGEQVGERDGKLALAVMARSCARRPRDAADVLLAALRENGVEIAHADFADEPTGPAGPAHEPFAQSWYLTSPIVRYEAHGELRCRVMMHEQAWVVCGVLGPTAEDDAEAWMRNKRVLDVARATLELAPAL
ncbi:MAG: hypothetical protein HY744_06045 [Deltaproteobacteria bacterium]|nr:hypothetical protein [Deltaproteobacteria bacterium]